LFGWESEELGGSAERIFLDCFAPGGASMASIARLGEEIPVAPAPVPWKEQNFAGRLEDAIERGASHLISLQDDRGYWQGELEADTTLESDYIYFLFVLGKAAPERIAKLANYVRARQLPDGGWSIYPGGPSELNATCKAYFALKLAGDSTDSSHLSRAFTKCLLGRAAL
jgi:hypothetical protein